MIIAVDSGHSMVKWGIPDEKSSWAETGVCEPNDLATLERAMAETGKAVVCNVAGEARAELLRAAATRAGAELAFLPAPDDELGVKSRYLPLETLGGDRWAALVATRKLHGHGLIIDAGTAITIDALNSSGEFLGGIILPGLRMMLGALSSEAGLPLVTPESFPETPADTANAIRAGAVYAAVGAAAAFRERTLGAKAPFILTGGDAPMLAPHLSGAIVEARLVLEGIRLRHAAR